MCTEETVLFQSLFFLAIGSPIPAAYASHITFYITLPDVGKQALAQGDPAAEPLVEGNTAGHQINEEAVEGGQANWHKQDLATRTFCF